jgi:hypothetical protein
MTLTELQDAFDRLGPDISAWPSSLAEPALDLISVSDDAKDLLAAFTRASLNTGQPGAPVRVSPAVTARASG